MLQHGVGLDDSLSNLTSVISNEASISSTTNMGSTTIPHNQQQHLQSFVSTNIQTQQQQQQQPPPKKRRNLPGNPDPEAEVVALSPTALMATNRFVCEICNKGFQRDQNLQLHRRGHNLPWKLKQRSNKDIIKKKVYVCPEPSCIHHDPSRALGDLTGIKKHFSRKHGEKKWKCEKCSKRYAVQSDWKAHSKICGTREYRCDCGTLFSRRDSFITHRAFCDALAEESSRSMTQNPLLSTQTAPNQPDLIHFHNPLILKQETQNFNPLSFQQNPNPNTNLPGNFSCSSSSFTSATALLQKAAQMGVTMSNKTTPYHTGAPGFSFGEKIVNLSSGCMELHDMNMVGGASNLPCTSGFDGSLGFDDSFSGMMNNKRNITSFQDDVHSWMSLRKESGGGGGSRGGAGGGGGGDGLTRDFLGLRGFSHRDFSNMAGFDQMGSSSYDHHHQTQNQDPWQN